jgi:hypothetical protein
VHLTHSVAIALSGQVLDAAEMDPSASLRAGSEAGAVVEDEIVALAVSAGLADGELALAGAVEEYGFGVLADAFGVGMIWLA